MSARDPDDHDDMVVGTLWSSGERLDLQRALGREPHARAARGGDDG